MPLHCSLILQETVNEVNGLAHRVKNQIQLLDEMNAHSLQQRGHGVGSASERTRTSITAGKLVAQ
jgi:syntaxin 1B/2/3